MFPICISLSLSLFLFISLSRCLYVTELYDILAAGGMRESLALTKDEQLLRSVPGSTPRALPLACPFPAASSGSLSPEATRLSTGPDGQSMFDLRRLGPSVGRHPELQNPARFAPPSEATSVGREAGPATGGRGVTAESCDGVTQTSYVSRSKKHFIGNININNIAPILLISPVNKISFNNIMELFVFPFVRFATVASG